MADEKVEGSTLRKLVKLGQKHPMAFAFSLGSDNTPLMLIDHRKSPSFLSKIAKKEGGSNKVAFGTFVLNAGTMELTCSRQIPGLGTALRKFLKNQNISVKVLISDENDGDPAGNDQTEDDAGNTGEKPGPPADLSAKELVERIKALQPNLANASAGFKKALGVAVTQIKSSSLEAADKTISALEKAAAKSSTVKKIEETTKEAPTESAGYDAQNDLNALVARTKVLKDVVAGIAAPTGDKLGAALVNVVKQIKANKLDVAAMMLGKIEAAANKTMIAAAKAHKQVEDDAEDQATSPDAEKWHAELARLQPLVDKMMAENRGDLAAINRFFNYAKEQAQSEVFDKALAAAARAFALLKEAAAASTTGAAQEAKADIADELVPYVKSRLSWIKTRSALHGELGKIKSAIDKKVSGIAGYEQVSSKTDGLFEYLDDIDSDLEETLESLVESPDGPERENLKNAATQIIDTYLGVLDSEFFHDIDKNGFVKTSIRATALSSLDEVRKALSL